MTINTNKQIKEDDLHRKDDIKIFDKSINHLLNNIDEYIKIPDTDRWIDKTIKKCDIGFTIERG